MDIFRVLSRGASLKKSKDIVTDYALPSVSGKPTRITSQVHVLTTYRKNKMLLKRRRNKI